jgi:hypothetical protein
MTFLNQAIQAVEHGLVATRKPGERKWDLRKRMQQYKVPGFSVALLPEKFIPRTATAHRSGESVPGKWHLYPEQAPAALWSTPSDLARLVIEVQKSHRGESNRVLSTEMTHQMVSPRIGISAMGCQITHSDDRICFGHPGLNEGFHSLYIGEIGTGRGLALMTNGDNGRKLVWDVTRAVADVFDWSWVN